MKKLFTILLSLLVAFVSNAQNTLNNIGLTSSTPASVAYSLRLLSSSYAGPLVRIKVGTSFYDVYPDLSTNKFSLSSKISASISTYNAAAAAAGTNALSTIISGSTDATVAIWYDQSGNGVHVLSSSATAKIITAGSILTMNGQPTINFYNSTSYLNSSTTVNYTSQTFATVNAVAQNVASTDAVSGIISTGPLDPGASFGGWGLNFEPGTWLSGYWVDGSGTWGAFSGVNSTEAKVVTALITKNANSSIYVNSELKGTKSTNTNVFSTADLIFVGARGTYAGRYFIGNIAETMIFPKNLSSIEQAALESSQSQFLPKTVTITSSASGTICAGTSVTFTATVTGISSPTYQWYKNNTAITGATSSTYSTTTLSNNDVIKVSVGDIIVSNSLIQNLDANNPSSYTSGNTWTDLTGNANNANIVTGVSGSIAIATEGNIKSFNFDKGTTYMSAPLSKSGSMSFNVWAKNTDLVNTYTNTGTMLFNAGASGTGPLNGGPDLFISSNKIYWNTYDAAGNPFKLNGTDITTTTAAINDNNWHQFTVVVDAVANSVYLYIDGVYKGTAGYKNPSTFSSPSALYIGGEGNNNTYNLGWIGKISAFQSYSRALSLSEVVQNFNAKASFFGVTSSASTFSNSITVSVNSLSVPTITVAGDACINKTTLTTTSGLSSYAWYKDNVVISGETSNTYTPSASGDYQVQVSNGSCSNTSTTTTIYTCGRTADGRMSPITSSTTLVTITGEKNSKYGIDERGLKLTKPFPVTANLILHLDATQSSSYGGTGTTWTDISGQLNNATLMGSPIFQSGSFTFAADKYALTSQKITTSMSSATFIAWVNPTTSKLQDNFAGIIFSRSNKGQASTNMGINFYSNNNVGYTWGDFNWNSTLVVPQGSWSMIAITISSTKAVAYLCNSTGTSSASVDALHNALSNLNFFIGNDPIFGTNLRAYDGKIATSMVYSNALTATQITQIFDCQKAAFGL